MKRTVGRAHRLAVGLAALLSGREVAAQGGAAAQALFERGVRELEAGRFDTACPALAESQRLDPHAGTLFALAECEAKSGKVASAVGHYQDYLGVLSRMSPEQLERHAERANTARAQIQALKAGVPTLALVLPAGAPPDVVVERGGVELQGPALGMALPTDPGEHVIVTRLPSGAEKRVVLTLAPGEHKVLELTLPEPPPAPAPLAVAPSPARQGESAGRSEPLRTWAWAIGGVGLAGVVTGAVTGIVALEKKAIVNEHCSGSACDAEGKAAGDSGKAFATASTVAFGVGLVAVGTSIALLIATEPRAGRPSAGLTPKLGLAPGVAWAGVERRF